MKYSIYILSIIGLIGLSSCADLDVQPKNAVELESAISDATSAEAAVLGVYSEFQGSDFDGWLSMNQYFSDEAVHTGTFPTRAEFGRLDVFPSNTTMAGQFTNMYDIINVANTIEASLPGVSDPSLTDALRNEFIAEAVFLRAYAYWYLVNNWGDVPLILEPTSPDALGVELQVPNAPASATVAQVIQDFQFAEANLPLTNGGTRASSMAAKVMLARAYLQQGDYAQALSKAQEVIDGGLFGLQPSYADIFDGGSAEQIWYLDFTSEDNNDNAFFYFPSALGGRLSISPSAEMLAAYEPGDLRFAASIDTASIAGQPFAIKYSDIVSGTDPIYFIRYAEVLLIASEAAAETGNFTLASDLINQVRERAGLAPITLDASNYVDAILQERFVEMAFEGHQRLWDLRRRGKAVEVLGPLGYDDPKDNVWPFPQRDIDRNPNLQQNPGY
ncbi:MAG: RagB/SusD family nutrient uptake outer membrane protein [Bacteroidota bacterium]